MLKSTAAVNKQTNNIFKFHGLLLFKNTAQKIHTKKKKEKKKLVFTQCANLKGDLHTILVR